ncbi:MAG: hypothetical protein ACOC5D_03600 [Thermoplasmatota archaeon]
MVFIIKKGKRVSWVYIIFAVLILAYIPFNPRWDFDYSMLIGFIVGITFLPIEYALNKSKQSKKIKIISITVFGIFWWIILMIVYKYGCVGHSLTWSFLAGVLLSFPVLGVVRIYTD